MFVVGHVVSNYHTYMHMWTAYSISDFIRIVLTALAWVGRVSNIILMVIALERPRPAVSP